MLVVCKSAPLKDKDGKDVSGLFVPGKTYNFSQKTIMFEYVKGSFRRSDNVFTFAYRTFMKHFEPKQKVEKAEYPDDVPEEETMIRQCQCIYCGTAFLARFHDLGKDAVRCPLCKSMLHQGER